MLRCLELGRKGFPMAAPNPAVGSLIECEGKILGEGYTQAYGGPHAEVMALAQVKLSQLLPLSTLYVSLEPCSHFGKTPPCVDRIIQSGIKRVVIGLLDPNPLVAGQGIEKLLNAGLQVHIGLCEQQIRNDLRFFLLAQEQKRPYTILKWAESPDGFLAPPADERKVQAPVWISNSLSRQQVHKLRSEVQSILIGRKTAEQDRARLTVRDWAGPSPHRVLVDPNGLVPENAPIYDDSAPTTLFISSPKEKSSAIKRKEANIMAYKTEERKDLPQRVGQYLNSIHCNSLLVEGGALTLQAYLDSGLWDEIYLFRGVHPMGRGISAPKAQGIPFHKSRLLNDTLFRYKHPENNFIYDTQARADSEHYL